MTEDSYADKEKRLLRKHQLELENISARRETLRLKSIGTFGEATWGFGPNPLDVEESELRERQSSELIALLNEEIELSKARQTKLPDVEPPFIPVTRRSFVQKILDEKGWSILDWANEAEVAHATAMDYLQDKTTPYRSTRLKLANALGVAVEELPK